MTFTLLNDFLAIFDLSALPAALASCVVPVVRSTVVDEAWGHFGSTGRNSFIGVVRALCDRSFAVLTLTDRVEDR
ncbi:hypothetical protein [Streptomyces collinus]|uniref:hypothetical protein n=1 Tax=Streptomyces collinus TaxID=42684 RepID=UPI0036415B8C